jgi:CheY-like chemotaxis protein
MPDVLLIDDDKAFFDKMTFLLKGTYFVTYSSSIDEARNLLAGNRRFDFDVLILDIHFYSKNDASGINFLRELYEGVCPPVIFVTQDEETELLVRASKILPFTLWRKNEFAKLSDNWIVDLKRAKESRWSGAFASVRHINRLIDKNELDKALDALSFFGGNSNKKCIALSLKYRGKDIKNNIEDKTDCIGTIIDLAKEIFNEIIKIEKTQ